MRLTEWLHRGWSTVKHNTNLNSIGHCPLLFLYMFGSSLNPFLFHWFTQSASLSLYRAVRTYLPSQTQLIYCFPLTVSCLPPIPTFAPILHRREISSLLLYVKHPFNTVLLSMILLAICLCSLDARSHSTLPQGGSHPLGDNLLWVLLTTELYCQV